MTRTPSQQVRNFLFCFVLAFLRKNNPAALNSFWVTIVTFLLLFTERVWSGTPDGLQGGGRIGSLDQRRGTRGAPLPHGGPVGPFGQIERVARAAEWMGLRLALAAWPCASQESRVCATVGRAATAANPLHGQLGEPTCQNKSKPGGFALEL